MFHTEHAVSVVTAILPNGSARAVMDKVVAGTSNVALVAKARGTLLHEAWWKRFAPPIGPTKTLVRMLAPTAEVDSLINPIIEEAKLHKQATGAVFSTVCDSAYLGSAFRALRRAPQDAEQNPEHALRNKLNVIYCVVAPQHSDRVGRAAIHAGAHGPVVYYSEGRGLRDRLGWLRITKERQKEVLLVIADDADVEEIFQAMAKAGSLHLPGRGFMYRLAIDKGLFNLPSRIAHPHYPANMQQIINALDHVTGHTHWRADATRGLAEGRSAGLDNVTDSDRLQDQVCLSAWVETEQSQRFMDLLLDAGAPGLNLSFARVVEGRRSENPARIAQEYVTLRCITARETAQSICAHVDASAEDAGLNDLGLFVMPVPRVATYVPGAKDFRRRRAA